MTYLEAVELLHQIEEKYDVMSIRYKGISVWPHLRLYLLDQISVKTELKASCSIIKIVLKSLFAYNPLKLFRQHDLWIFTGCERRKQIGDKMIHRISGGITTCYDDYLMLEKPDLHIGHYSQKEIEEKNIVSEAWLLVLFHLIQVALRPFRLKIENEGVIQRVLLDNHLNFDYRHYIRSLNAKRLSLLWIFHLSKKPKLAIMECPYDSMGYLWAFHQKGVKILEMQHGVAGRSHNAYNSKIYESRMNPDGICVFGNEEYNYFTKEVPQYSPNVFMTGLYMLEKADLYFNEDIFADYRLKYNKIIVCSGQNGFEDALSSFANKIAVEHPDLLFMYIPRQSNTEIQPNVDNIVVVRDVNIYQYLKWADIHVTISSTTCLEAQYYQTPTIFYDYEKRASTYYGELLKNENGAFYVSTLEGFAKALLSLSQSSVKYQEVFVHDHIKRITTAINNMLKKYSYE